MAVHTIAVHLDEEHFRKLQAMQIKSKLKYDDLLARIIDEAK